MYLFPSTLLDLTVVVMLKKPPQDVEYVQKGDVPEGRFSHIFHPITEHTMFNVHVLGSQYAQHRQAGRQVHTR